MLTVINNGSDAVTIKTIGFESVDASVPSLDFLTTWGKPGGERVLPTTGGTEAALLPARIEGHDCRIFEYSPEALKDIRDGKYRAYAERYKAFRLWPKGKRSTVRIAKSRVFTIARKSTLLRSAR